MAIKFCNPDLDSGDDDGSSEANAFRTLAQCLTSGGANTLSAGDILYIKKTSSPHDPGADLTYDLSGSSTGEILIEGYGTTVGDNVQFEIEFSADAAGGFACACAFGVGRAVDDSPEIDGIVEVVVVKK